MKNYLILALFTGLLLPVQAQKTDEIYDFPVKPGTEEWARFTTGKQMREACQIPIERLNILSTKALVETCMNYPLFLDYVAFNNERQGVKAIIKNFNGLQELSRREDCVKELISFYARFPIITQNAYKKDITQYQIQYKLPFLELVIADSLFISQLSQQEIIELKNIALEKYVEKLENMSVYGLYNVKKTMLLLAVLLDMQNDTTDDQRQIIKSFIQNYNQPDADLLTAVSKVISGL